MIGSSFIHLIRTTLQNCLYPQKFGLLDIDFLSFLFHLFLINSLKPQLLCLYPYFMGIYNTNKDAAPQCPVIFVVVYNIYV